MCLIRIGGFIVLSVSQLLHYNFKGLCESDRSLFNSNGASKNRFITNGRAWGTGGWGWIATSTTSTRCSCSSWLGRTLYIHRTAREALCKQTHPFQLYFLVQTICHKDMKKPYKNGYYNKEFKWNMWRRLHTWSGVNSVVNSELFCFLTELRKFQDELIRNEREWCWTTGQFWWATK